MNNSYLKVTTHQAHVYNGTEERALELVALIGSQRSEAHYFHHIGITGAEKQFTGKLAIYGRNGVSYVLPNEVLMHDVVSNEWYPVTQEQFARQYRAFSFQNCNTSLGTINCNKIEESGASCSPELVGPEGKEGLPGPDYIGGEAIRGAAGPVPPKWLQELLDAYPNLTEDSGFLKSPYYEVKHFDPATDTLTLEFALPVKHVVIRATVVDPQNSALK